MPGTGEQVFKFGYLNNSQEEQYFYPDTWAIEKTSGPERLIAGPSVGHVSMLLELSHYMPEPLGILYVLTVPRGDDAVAGRYQTSIPKSRKEVEEFLLRFMEFFERDGRHHVWVASLSTADLLVYDRHNVIYVYGELQTFASVLGSRGLTKSEWVRLPVPHIHKYNAVYDSEQSDLMRYWEWKRSDLRNGDD